MSQDAPLTGAEIAALYKKSNTIDVVIHDDKNNKDLKFTIMPMDNVTFAKMANSVDVKDLKTSESDDMISSIKIFGDVWWPIMKAVLPACCVNPKVIDGDSSEPNVINIKYLSAQVMIALFEKIFENSGLGDKGEEDRKN